MVPSVLSMNAFSFTNVRWLGLAIHMPALALYLYIWNYMLFSKHAKSMPGANEFGWLLQYLTNFVFTIQTLQLILGITTDISAGHVKAHSAPIRINGSDDVSNPKGTEKRMMTRSQARIIEEHNGSRLNGNGSIRKSAKTTTDEKRSGLCKLDDDLALAIFPAAVVVVIAFW